MTGPLDVTRLSTGRLTVVTLPVMSTGDVLMSFDASETATDGDVWLSEMANLSFLPWIPPVALTCFCSASSALRSCVPRKDALPVIERIAGTVTVSPDDPLLDDPQPDDATAISNASA